MEALDKAANRVRQEQYNRQRQPPAVRNLDDIRKILASLTAGIAGSDGESVIQIADSEVKCTTKFKTNRDLIIDGLRAIQSRPDAEPSEIAINGKRMKPAAIFSDTRLPVDLMIEGLLGAKRHGHMIQWDLPDGNRYQYDIFQHRLFKV